jgi:hypothetical protein
LVACTPISTTNGSTLPFIILCALTYVFFYSLFTLEPEAHPSSIFFFMSTYCKVYLTSFLFSNVVSISLILIPLIQFTTHTIEYNMCSIYLLPLFCSH